ncbi:MAG TPA: hypothetical protein VH186_08125 [Chloroflexia bacterium]|nr:hypothetical protein [Chloroflexia bacterium]
MHGTSDYNVCISALDDGFVPGLENVSRLIDFLDSNLFLEGPDRYESNMVMLPAKETASLKELVRTGPQTALPVVRKRYVHLLYPPTSVEHPYGNFGELSIQVENMMPRDKAFVATLGRGTRRLFDLAYVQARPNEERRWMQFVSARLLRGYHALWDRVWDERSLQRVWELQSVKGFTLMINCKLVHNATPLPLPEYIKRLESKPDFVQFMDRMGQILGTREFELIGEHGN